MLTAEIKVNGARVAEVHIVNVGGANGWYPFTGIAKYAVTLYTQRHRSSALNVEPQAVATIEDWDRSRPAQELVQAALTALTKKGARRV